MQISLGINHVAFSHPLTPHSLLRNTIRGQCLSDIDLLRWAENRLLQSVFTLNRMKCGGRECTIAARVFHLSTLALPCIFCYNTRVGRLAHLARALRWQRRGEEFESPILHQIIQASIVACFLFFTLTISLTFAILTLGQYVVFCYSS